jgi:hypothetical protein
MWIISVLDFTRDRVKSRTEIIHMQIAGRSSDAWRGPPDLRLLSTQKAEWKNI